MHLLVAMHIAKAVGTLREWAKQGVCVPLKPAATEASELYLASLGSKFSPGILH